MKKLTKKVLVYFLSVAVVIGFMPSFTNDYAEADSFVTITGDYTIEKSLGDDWSYGTEVIIDDTSCGTLDQYQVMAIKETNGQTGEFKYTLEATEPADYRITSSDINAKAVSENSSYDGKNISSGESESIYNVFRLNKGEKITFALTGKDGVNNQFKVERMPINCIKSIDIGGNISMEAGSYKEIKVDCVWYDSSRDKEYSVIDTVSVKRWNDEGKLVGASIGEVKFEQNWDDKNLFEITANTVGKYQLQIKTTQKVTATIELTVTPEKPNVSGYSATGKNTSSTISIYHSLNDIDGYEVYLKTSDGYKLQGKSKKSGSYHKYTVTGLKANKVYTVKVKSYKAINYKDEKTTVKSPYSKEFKIVTAPTKAPKITSLSAVKTKYYKATSSWVSGHWDAGGVWHDGYYVKSKAHSVVTVKIKNSKVSGASYYETNWSKVSNGKITKSFGGKAKASKKSIKVRAVKKAGNAVAYGPWSKAKKVKIKAAA